MAKGWTESHFVESEGLVTARFNRFVGRHLPVSQWNHLFVHRGEIRLFPSLYDPMIPYFEHPVEVKANPVVEFGQVLTCLTAFRRCTFPMIRSTGIVVPYLPDQWIPTPLTDSKLIKWARVPQLAEYFTDLFPEVYPTPQLARVKLVQYLRVESGMHWLDVDHQIVYRSSSACPKQQEDECRRIMNLDVPISRVTTSTHYVVTDPPQAYQNLWNARHWAH